MARRGNLQRRSLLHALASRERDGASYQLETLIPRTRWTMDQVLSLEDCAVLLGFSSDGNHLLYYSHWETSYVVLWKRIRSALAVDRVELSLALRLQVGKRTTTTPTFGDPNVGSRLRVWQSSDDHIVTVIAMDSHIASQDSGPSYHFTLSPSPSFCFARACFKSTSLSFSYTLPSPTQDVESWQLLANGESKYLLVLNMGSSVVVMALCLRQVHHQPAQSSQAALPRLQFDHRVWYSPSEFPIEFSCDAFNADVPSPTSTMKLECLCQQEFDCEAFLADFFRKYAAFSHLHLVDYDLRLVRAALQESLLFMTCIADLESSPSISSQRIDQPRFALFFTLEINTGEYHIVRALKVPRHQPLRHLSAVLARKFLADLVERNPLDLPPTEWNNDPVVRGQSLDAVHNPRFPVSIYFK